MSISQPTQLVASGQGAQRVVPGIWKLAGPVILANLLQSSVALVDAKAVGSLGAAAFAAATTGHRLFYLFQAVLTSVSVGAGALISRAWGAGRRDEAAHVLRASLGVACVVALVIGVVGFASARPFARMFGLSGEPEALAIIYVRYISSFAFAFACAFVIGTSLRAAGDTRTPLFVGAITNVVNILCLIFFVYGHWGFPKLGIRGAALAGGVAFASNALMSIVLWSRGRLPLRLLTPDGEAFRRCRDMLRIGYPAALEQLTVQVGLITFTSIVARGFGTPALVAYGIGVNILSLSFVVGFGFSTAAATLVGQHMGAGEPEAAIRSGWHAAKLAVGSMTVLAVIVVRFAGPIAHFIVPDPAVAPFTISLIYVLGVAQPLMAIEYGLAGALRGAGDTRFPLLCTLTGLASGRVLCAGFLTVCRMPVEWVYGTLLVDYAVRATMLVVRFRRRRWQSVLARQLCQNA